MVEQIRPVDLAARRHGGEDWQLIDVREAWEREIVSLPQSVHIPMGEIPSRSQEIDAERPVAVLCHGGFRSQRVAEYLLSVGFRQVANVAGGIDAWAREVDHALPRY